MSEVKLNCRPSWRAPTCSECLEFEHKDGSKTKGTGYSIAITHRISDRKLNLKIHKAIVNAVGTVLAENGIIEPSEIL